LHIGPIAIRLTSSRIESEEQHQGRNGSMKNKDPASTHAWSACNAVPGKRTARRANAAFDPGSIESRC
jgi:hypothetical protein